MMQAMIAGKIEKSIHIIRFTASASEMVMTVWPVASVPETKPAIPNSRATS